MCIHRGIFTCGYNNEALAELMRKQIPSSRAFDSVCDCCDGSDEKEGLCANTCGASIEKLKDEAIQKYRKVLEGRRLRLSSLENAKELVEEWKSGIEKEKENRQESELELLYIRLKFYLAQEEKIERRERIRRAKLEAVPLEVKGAIEEETASDKSPKRASRKKEKKTPVHSLDEILGYTHADTHGSR